MSGVGEAATAAAIGTSVKRCLRSRRTSKFLRRLCICCCKNGEGDDDEVDGSYNYETRSTSVILSCCGTVTTDSVDNLQLNRNNSAYKSRDRHAAVGVATVTAADGSREDD